MSKITDKIENMIKKSILDKGLVKTGRMLNSISVTENDTGYSINSVDYFAYVNDEYSIVDDVLNSPELALFIETTIKEEFENILKI